MWDWANDLFPLCRSITGEPVRETLRYFQEIVPDLTIHAVPTGTKVMDWTIPNEWSIEEAYIENSDGEKIIDFKEHNLHILNYSIAVDDIFDLKELEKHIYTLPDMPDAIPYVTSYYKERWGFCMTQNQKDKMKPGKYRAVIKSDFKEGELNYGEIIIPGKIKEEIFISSYICHPSMANNELSGPVLAIALAKWLQSLPNRKYTYRFSLAPETIGAISYISENIDTLTTNVIAAFNLSCVGDNGNFSFMPSRLGETLADRVALNILNHEAPDFNAYSFLERGSDERHYCSPGVNLPMVSIMRTKYGKFSEYHTSLDNMDFISQEALEGTLAIHQKCIMALENNDTWKTVKPCEPFLSKHNLYPDIGLHKTDYTDAVNILNFLAYADGDHDLIAISDRINVKFEDCLTMSQALAKAELIEKA
jgi:aminopeptidase-like protein